MTVGDDAVPQDSRATRSNRTKMPGHSTSRSSYDTAESSTNQSVPVSATSNSTLVGTSHDHPQPVSKSPSDGHHPGRTAVADMQSGQKAHRHRHSGGFLLQDALLGAQADGKHGHRKRISRTLLHNVQGKRTLHTTEKRSSGTSGDVELGLDSGPSSPASTTSPDGSGGGLSVSKLRASTDETASRPVAITDASPLDADSAQIVDMALRISQSRRIASQRRVSQTLPPRLAPLPDASAGGSLRQHLQQQRKISRNASPRLDKVSVPRSLTGAGINSPLPTSFEPGLESSFRWHFSASTLARAQKAKEHIELMAQYRRLLDIVPPLRRTAGGRSGASSPPSSPVTTEKLSMFRDFESGVRLGREYNPLQYIRNRKVRTRERSAIDGHAQGFGDVLRVTDWVDETAKSAAQGHKEGQSLPYFTPTDYAPLEPPLPLAPAQTTTRPKRPRVDWLIDPVDMIADAYWLEQDQNKLLIEDRHWKRIFPQSSDLHQPTARQTEESEPNTTPNSSRRELSGDSPGDPDPSELNHTRADTEHSHSSARERARQKLQDLKGFHHRHTSSVQSHHDSRLIKRSSLLDLSDSDNEGKEGRFGSGTITSNSKDILAKQMQEMIAREERENQAGGYTSPKTPVLSTPEKGREAASQPPSRFHSRQGSFAEVSESDGKSARENPRRGSPHRHRPGRLSLDVPSRGRRGSTDVDVSAPNSPTFGPERDSSFGRAHGMNGSPASSRPSSPTRKGFAKVKHIFHDRSKERGSDPKDERAGARHPVADVSQSLADAVGTLPDRRLSPERRGSRSPSKRVLTKSSNEVRKTHRATPSMRLRGEDQGNGVRGIFKGPGVRIDNMIRGGVSRLTDLLWRKEPNHGETMSEGQLTDESETEQRGRRIDSPKSSGRESLGSRGTQSRTVSKSYLELMPPFRPGSSAGELGREDDALSPPTKSGVPSLSPSRFDRLKPPKIDVQSESPPQSRPPKLSKDSDYSDGDSGREGRRAGMRDRRIGSVISMPPSFAPGQQRSSLSMQSRHWSISKQSPVRDHTPITKREIARLRALILSSGIKAMEISRRANEPQRLFATDNLPSASKNRPPARNKGLSWPDIAAVSTDSGALYSRTVTQAELYHVAARTLGNTIQSFGERWQVSAAKFSEETAPRLGQEVENLRVKVAVDLSQMTRGAADEADETTRDLVLGQRLKVRKVVDVIEKMLRRRRRRFRWVRRAMWLGVEWVLVGFMWYVWFVVVILRVILGVGQGIGKSVKWLLWL